MDVCYFGREVCFYCNSHSVTHNKQQHFQQAAPRFVLFSVCGIGGEKPKLQKGKSGKELDCCVYPGSCCGVLNQICNAVISTCGMSEPVGSNWVIPQQVNMVWKLLETSGDLVWTAQKSVCKRLNSNFWKNESGRILSNFPYCFNLIDYSISSVLTLYCWSGNLRVSQHFVSIAIHDVCNLMTRMEILLV